MATYTVVGYYTQYVATTIEANSLEDAINIAKFDVDNGLGMFDDAEGVGESPYKLDYIVTPDGNREYLC